MVDLMYDRFGFDKEINLVLPISALAKQLNPNK